MKCPVDGAQLVMTERSGVEIDYCPQCRGVWLDRGELDKIIDRATPAVTLPEPPREAPRGEVREPPRQEYRDPRGDYRGDPRSQYRDDDYHKRKKRKSFLDDIFDF
jgi:Zn-finger nucleic acid-binding protein